jgi:uroporphyrinogen III methyltransferase/synthase
MILLLSFAMIKSQDIKRKKRGICYLVGVGPGDPGLLTLKAKACIEEADVLVYDYLCNPLFLKYAKEGVEKIYVGKKAKDHAMKQEDINALICKLTKEGKVVTRLKGGDPVLFGRGAEEAEELVDAGVLFEMVPGITSAISGPAYAGIPVTHREHCSQLTIFTGHEDPTKAETSLDYAKIAKADGTKVFLMGVERIEEISSEFLKHGADPQTPVALVRWATRGNQETLVGVLSDISVKVKEKGFKAPAVAVVGSVVNLREKINWFEKRPLFGKRVVVTRTRQQASALTSGLQRYGAEVLEIPTIKIAPPEDMMGFGQMVQDAHTYDWLVFTSPNGVESFFKLFFKLYKDARSIGGVKIACVGPSTAAKVREFHFDVDLMPEKKFVAEGLIEAFKEKENVEHQSLLWVRAEETRDVIADGLTALLGIVDEAVAYQTLPEIEGNTEVLAALKQDGAEVITFTSASTVAHFAALGVELPEGIVIASIGPVTSQAIVKKGWKVGIEAKQSTIEGLVEAIVEHYGGEF